MNFIWHSIWHPGKSLPTVHTSSVFKVVMKAVFVTAAFTLITITSFRTYVTGCKKMTPDNSFEGQYFAFGVACIIGSNLYCL